MQIHIEILKVVESDLDELKHVNNVRYVQWVNNIAKAHWLKMASKFMIDNYFWVLINHRITYKSQAILNDNIQLKTFVKSTESVTSTRIVEIYNCDTEKLLATSETKWCFMSFETKRPIRIIPEVVNLFQ